MTDVRDEIRKCQLQNGDGLWHFCNRHAFLKKLV